MTKKQMKELIRDNMPEGQALQYIPVQKLTVALSLTCLVQMCSRCGRGKRKCKDCIFSTLEDRLADAIRFPPMFDENFNLLPPPIQVQENYSQQKGNTDEDN